jgi:hypothetical protein
MKKKINYLLLNMKVLTPVGGFVKNFKRLFSGVQTIQGTRRPGHLGQGWIDIAPFEIMKIL